MRSLVRAALAAALLVVPATAQEPPRPTEEPKPSARPEVYDPGADAREQIATARKVAARDNKRILVVFGSDWSRWCQRLHEVFTTHRGVARLLRDEYEVVNVDVGRWNRNMDLAADMGADVRRHGIPFLVVLDAEGQVVTGQETSVFEEGPSHVPERIEAFLEANEAIPIDARAALEHARTRSAADGRKLFVHVSAPWCGWCHRLEDFLADPEVAAILAKDLIVLKIDKVRMTHGKEVFAELRGDRTRSGLPWIIVIDPQGKEVITSDGPKGNVGYPIEDPEIDHFVAMIEACREQMSDEDVATLRRLLEERARQIETARKE